ncbi:MAG: 1-acyl-sn-glycerol-3-phosphate acyltransferase [Muribaculaceae bacterium]|nr:1-acyl-sn-glycerol-3-phosphate acyltransferase [Muribaculaceae bacterium]
MSRILIFVYQWCIAIPLLVVATILTALITILGCLIGCGKWAGYYPPHIWARLWCILMFVRVRVSGRENINSNTSYIFVCNHQGAYDIFSIYGYLNHRFYWMMKKSLEKIPLVGLACKEVGHIMVDQSSASAIKRTMQTAESRLKGGNSLVVFPEGARTWDGKMRRFKRGAFLLASEFRLPIVPVTIDGAFSVMPRFTYNIKPGVINITIHKPIDAPSNSEEMDNAMKESFASIQSSLPEKDRGMTQSLNQK